MRKVRVHAFVYAFQNDAMTAAAAAILSPIRPLCQLWLGLYPKERGRCAETLRLDE